MSRSSGSAGRGTRVVLSGLLAGGSLALGAGTASAVGAPDPWAPVTYTDSTQPFTYVVPAGACAITLDAVGGQGGNGIGGTAGGLAGHVVSTVAVMPAEQAQIFVGGRGSLSFEPNVVRRTSRGARPNTLRHWLGGDGAVRPDIPAPGNGGLSGGEPTGGAGGIGTISDGGGGGGSYVFLGSTANYPVVVAGGGGGAAGSDPDVTGGNGGAGGATGTAGTAGAGALGDDGLPRTSAAGWDGTGGGGGGAAQGGAAGAAGTDGAGGTAGILAYGGAGGGDSFDTTSGAGGGGGGGIFGGGGGGSAWRQNSDPAEAAGGGGGGGSNLAPAGSAVNSVTTHTGDGSVTVTPHATCPPSAVQHVSATAGDASATVTWTAPADSGGAPITSYRITTEVGGVARTTVTSPGAGLTFTVPGLTNGTRYTFTVAAVTSAGTGPSSVASNVVTPVGPPVPPFALTSQTLWGHVEIGPHRTRIAFEVTFNQTRPALEVTLTSKTTGRVLGATTIRPATPSERFTGVVAFPTSRITTWGAYTWTLTTGSPASVFTFRADIRRHSTLALDASRRHGVVTVVGSAKVLNTTSDSYVAWAHRRVEIQRETATGWVTIAAATTDGAGHLRTRLRLSGRVTLRLVDADTATQFGRASNIRRV